MTVAAKTAIITTTINTSISVNAARARLPLSVWFLSPLWLVSGRYGPKKLLNSAGREGPFALCIWIGTATTPDLPDLTRAGRTVG